MKLCLHVGTEKTGSSFVQSVLCESRDILQAKGIHFPLGTVADERSMRLHRISAGNGRFLADAVSRENWRAVQRIVAQYAFSANSAQCRRVLVSSEQLLPALSKPGRVDNLLGMTKNAGFDSVDLGLILRNPVDQAVSLYRHRAKNGTISDVESWFSEKYRVLDQLQSLNAQMSSEEQGALTCMGYTPDSSELCRRFFGTWLGLDLKKSSDERRVNESLLVSELHLINACGKYDRMAPQLLRDAFQRLRREDRQEDDVWREYLEYLARLVVAKHASEWQVWNSLLSEDQRFPLDDQLPAPRDPPQSLVISNHQLDIALDTMEKRRSFNRRLKVLWLFYLRRWLSRVKRLLLNGIDAGRDFAFQLKRSD